VVDPSPSATAWALRRSLACRLEGHTLVDVEDLLVPEFYEGNSGLNGRVVFGRDGKIYMSTGGGSQNDVADRKFNPRSPRS
jgi:hypothetical protein